MEKGEIGGRADGAERLERWSALYNDVFVFHNAIISRRCPFGRDIFVAKEMKREEPTTVRFLFDATEMQRGLVNDYKSYIKPTRCLEIKMLYSGTKTKTFLVFVKNLLLFWNRFTRNYRLFFSYRLSENS